MQNNPIQIMLADDDEDDRMFFKEALEDIKMKTIVTSVNDGVELIDYFKNNNQYKPHILFLDLNMPRKNGIEALKELRNNEATKDFVIAIYSTSNSDKDIEDTFIQGANIYIRKPNEFDALKKTLEEVLSINWQYHTSGLNKETFLLSI